MKTKTETLQANLDELNAINRKRYEEFLEGNKLKIRKNGIKGYTLQFNGDVIKRDIIKGMKWENIEGMTVAEFRRSIPDSDRYNAMLKYLAFSKTIRKEITDISSEPCRPMILLGKGINMRIDMRNPMSSLYDNYKITNDIGFAQCGKFCDYIIEIEP